MRILVTGSTGLLGTAVVERLRKAGHEVSRLVRSESSRPDAYRWSPAQRELDSAALEGRDAVLHLAGESIAGGRWTQAKKRRIRESRALGTSLVAERLAEMDNGPRVLVSVSGISYYGDRGDDWVREDDPPGDLFLSRVCVDWEQAAEPARRKGVRVVHPRIGVVLSPEGGALEQMLPPFKLGLGGPIGGGRQWMSWISLEDVVALLVYCLENDEVHGPVNAVAPEPSRNADFVETLGKVIGRPTVIPVPGFGIQALFGQMGRELLLASTRASAERVLGLGFAFRHPELEGALRAELNR